jgi:hypothetical protein
VGGKLGVLVVKNWNNPPPPRPPYYFSYYIW